MSNGPSRLMSTETNGLSFVQKQDGMVPSQCNRMLTSGRPAFASGAQATFRLKPSRYAFAHVARGAVTQWHDAERGPWRDRQRRRVFAGQFSKLGHIVHTNFVAATFFKSYGPEAIVSFLTAKFFLGSQRRYLVICR